MIQEGKTKEKMILSHEPVPGYRTVFYIVLIASVIYLGIVFLSPVL